MAFSSKFRSDAMSFYSSSILFIGIILFFLPLVMGCSSPFGKPVRTVQNESAQNESTQSENGQPDDQGAGEVDDQVDDPIDSGQIFNGKPGSFNLSFQGRDYRLYVPSSYSSEKSAMMITMFHGAGDDYGNFSAIVQYTGWISLAEKQAVVLLIPAHMNSSRASFLHFTSTPGQLDQAATEREMDGVFSLIDEVRKDYNLDSRRLYWLGFSEGGAFATLSASFASHKVAAIGSYGSAAPKYPSTTITRKTPLLFVVGEADSGQYDYVVSVADEWEHRHDYSVTRRYYPGVSHSFSGLNQKFSPEEAWSWFSQSSL